MSRFRVPRSVAAATAAVVLIVGLMASSTSASPLSAPGGNGAAAAKPKPTPSPSPTPTPSPTPIPSPTPTPTPNSDNRIVYFGDPATDPDGNRQLVLTPVTTGGTFVFDVLGRNDGNQTLTHAAIALGDETEPWAGAPSSADSLPFGATIVSAIVTDSDGLEIDCPDLPLAATGFSCEVGNLGSGDFITASFAVKTGTQAVSDGHVWASFKVAENVNDQGANSNTAFAHSDITIDPTSSNANATFVRSGPFALSTAGQTEPTGGDIHTTTVNAGPNGTATGFISILEENGPTGCVPRCIGQLVNLNVNNGDEVLPYLEWTLVIEDTDVQANKGGVIHTDDLGVDTTIPNTNRFGCSPAKVVDCIVSYVVDDDAGTTTIVFRTATNGKAKAY